MSGCTDTMFSIMSTMNKPSKWYTARTAILVGTLPIAGGLAYLATLATTWRPTIALVTAALSWFLWASNKVLARHQQVYFAWERFKRNVLNSTSRWSFSARLRLAPGADAPALFDQTLRQLLDAPGTSMFTREERAAALLVQAVP